MERHDVLYFIKEASDKGTFLSLMLLILIMVMLNSLGVHATLENLPQLLAVQAETHQIYLCVGDIVMFLKPTREDLSLGKQTLEFFCHVSDLKTNILKSSITPIQGIIVEELSCGIMDFPCSYLASLGVQTYQGRSSPFGGQCR